MGLDAGDPIKESKREISLAYFGSSSNFIFVTVSRNSLNGAGQKLHSMSGAVAIFFLQTRKLLVSPCVVMKVTMECTEVSTRKISRS